MPPHKSEDYKITAVQYYLSKNNNQVKTCKIFKCHQTIPDVIWDKDVF